MKTGLALGGQIISGWFAKRFGEYSGGSGFIWTADRKCLLGGNVRNGPRWQHVRFPDGAEMKIHSLNGPRGSDELALYTPQYAGQTDTNGEGVEVVIQVNEPVGILPDTPGVKGRILAVHENAGSAPLFFDCVVLSANGRAATELLKHARAGMDISVDLGLRDYGHEAIGLSPANWRRAYASIGGPKCVLVNGTVPRDWEAKAALYAREGKKHGSVIKDPRTAVTFDHRYLYLLVIDGRSKASIGMTFTEVGEFCKDKLKATHAILQDGGGSSTLWADGKVRNRPSDRGGKLRPVANGYLVAVLLPPRKSNTFHIGQKITHKQEGELRLGPGTNFGTIAKIQDREKGTILPHRLNGILATCGYWWYCRFGGREGWVCLERPKGDCSLRGYT